jgi:hypothetical protein
MVGVFTIIEPERSTNIQIVFNALSCEAVDVVSDGDAATADFRLEGDVRDWTAMFGDIVANGEARGEWTINSLALRGDRIRCVGDDPMGLDKFSRFNQTLQQFLDGANLVESDAESVEATDNSTRE